MGGYRLGVDFGTSSTVAMLAGPDGRVKPLLFDGSPLLSSGVFAGPDTSPLLTGADAERAASGHPAGFEPNPKRRIDDGVVWLAEREIAVTDAIGAILARVSAEARRVAGRPPETVVVTHPAGWSRTRLEILAAAMGQAQLGEGGFVAEPVAAAAYFADVLDHELPVGRCLVVYDLGAGTCDVSIVRRTQEGLEVVASGGLDDVGGLDLDAAIVTHARSLTTNTDVWGRLEWPQTPADQRAHQQLWRDARTGKEQLSRHTSADLHIPIADTTVHITRDEFETAARPHLQRTVDLTATLLRDTAVPRQDIAGIFLVGGSSRVPLVASLLHRTLRIAPTTLDHPELVVAEGTLHTTQLTTEQEPPAPIPATPFPTAPVLPTDTPTITDDAAQPTTDIPADAKAERATFAATTATIIAGLRSLMPRWPPRTRNGKTTSATIWPPRTHRGKATVAVVAIMAIIAAAGLWDFLPTEPPPTEPSAIFTGHAASVTSVAFSPDGKTLATASNDNTARLWDVTTGETTATLTGHTDTVRSVAFSPDGKTLATGSIDDTVRLWDVATGDTTATLSHTSSVNGVAFSPDGKTLATGSIDDTVRLWDVATGDTTATLSHTSSVESVAFSPDGKTLAAGSDNNTVRLWDVATGETNATFSGTSQAYGVAFSPDGKIFATSSIDNTVQLWEAVTGRTIATLSGHTDSVKSVAFSPDGKTLATGSNDNTARLWDVATGETTATLSHTDSINGVAFSPDGKTLATGSYDDTVRLWKVAD